MIQSAFNAFGLTGKIKSSFSIWYLDSRASNHTTLSSKKSYYNVNLQVHTANKERIPIAAVDDIPHSLPLRPVFLTLCLSTNPLCVGQLVEKNYNRLCRERSKLGIVTAMRL